MRNSGIIIAAGLSAGFDGFYGVLTMAKNTKKIDTAATAANNNAAKTAANKIAVAAVSPDQSEVISNLTQLVKQLLGEISELKAASGSAKVPAKVPAKVNVVPANKFTLLAEGEVISELVTISAIGTPFSSKWGARQAVNCVTANGNTIVTFVNIVRDAIGNTIACGLVGGASYVMTGIASGKTSEFNGLTSNIINKAKFAKA